jgi:hypothetical protein
MPRHKTQLTWLIVGGIGSGAVPASAQVPYPTQGQHIPGVPRTLERIDPSYGDVSPLGESLRDVNMRVDLRTPFGFNDVYRVPGREDLLMRANGGMYAIFPQSVYVPSERGMAATVPPGTVFSIGIPGRWTLPSHWVQPPLLQPMGGAALRNDEPTISPDARRPWAGSAPIDSRRRGRRGAISPTAAWSAEGAPPLDDADVLAAAFRDAPQYQVARATPPEPATFLKSVATDDDYRARRLAELMDAALRAAKGERETSRPE